MVNLRSASGLILQAAEQRAILLLLGKPVMDEYRAVLDEPELAGRFRLDSERLELALRRLRYLADYPSKRAHAIHSPP